MRTLLRALIGHVSIPFRDWHNNPSTSAASTLQTIPNRRCGFINSERQWYCKVQRARDLMSQFTASGIFCCSCGQYLRGSRRERTARLEKAATATVNRSMCGNARRVSPRAIHRVISGRSMDRFEQLKQKYASVLALIQKQGVQLAHLHVQDNKLYLQGTAPSESIKNAVWNQIKSINPAYDDITADLSVNASMSQPAAAASSQTYTVKAGDSLSKIAKQFYGNPTEYMRIF